MFLLDSTELNYDADGRLLCVHPGFSLLCLICRIHSKSGSAGKQCVITPLNGLPGTSKWWVIMCSAWTTVFFGVSDCFSFLNHLAMSWEQLCFELSVGFLTHPRPTQFLRLLPWGHPSPRHPRVPLLWTCLEVDSSWTTRLCSPWLFWTWDTCYRTPPSVSRLALLFCRILYFVRSILWKGKQVLFTILNYTCCPLYSGAWAIVFFQIMLIFLFSSNAYFYRNALS